MARARGTFEVELPAETPDDESEGTNLGRRSIRREFHGDLEATSLGTMLTATTGVEGSAGYVAIERVRGSLAGKVGSFVLQHDGLMNRGVPRLTVAVVPDSGRGKLSGLSGRMTIRIEKGIHYYEFEYLFAKTRRSSGTSRR
jgi:Protein of unknown function (DUF3224)